MTIHQLPKPCFVLDPSPWERDEGNPHYVTWAEADEALRERREEIGPDPRDLAVIESCHVKQLDAPCWVAECDAPRGLEGTCGDTLGDEDEGPACIHFETLDGLLAWLPIERWLRAGVDHALCYTHQPHYPDDPPQPPSSPAEQEKAGQLIIPGVLA